MSKQGGHKGVAITFAIILIVILLIFVGWLWQYLVNKTSDQNKVIGQQEQEIKDLQEKLLLERSRQNWATIVEIGKWVVVAATLIICLWLFLHFRSKENKKMMTQDKACEKTAKRLTKMGFPTPLYCTSNSHERVKDKKLYMIAAHYMPKLEGFRDNWNHIKWFGVIADDWDHGRVENIEQGLSDVEALEFCLHELERHGYHVQKETEASVAEAIVKLKEGKKAQDDVLKDLGVESGGGQ